MARPRIGVLTSHAATSRRTWSGIPYYMAQALERHCGDVVYLGPVVSPLELAGKVRNKLSQKLLGRRRAYHHTLELSQSYARAFHAILRRHPELDVIFAPAASTEIAKLELDIPLIYTSDATFQLMRDYYPGFSGLSEDYARVGNEIEQRALDRSSIVTYPSDWAASSARAFYGVASEKVSVFPYGANLDRVPQWREIVHAKSARKTSLLFLGVDWERKGGKMAFRTTAALRERGIAAELTVCGCVPPRECRADWVRVVRRLDKNRPEEQAELSRLLLEAKLLFLPSRQECFGIVFCEASAHGTPSIATATGGIEGAVRIGENGFLLSPDAGPEAYADRIEAILGDSEGYRRLVQSSRNAFEERLNWDSWALHVRDRAAAVLM